MGRILNELLSHLKIKSNWGYIFVYLYFGYPVTPCIPLQKQPKGTEMPGAKRPKDRKWNNHGWAAIRNILHFIKFNFTFLRFSWPWLTFECSFISYSKGQWKLSNSFCLKDSITLSMTIKLNPASHDTNDGDGDVQYQKHPFLILKILSRTQDI